MITKDKIIGIRVDEEMNQSLNLVAKADGRTASGYIRRVIEREVKKDMKTLNVKT